MDEMTPDEYDSVDEIMREFVWFAVAVVAGVVAFAVIVNWL